MNDVKVFKLVDGSFVVGKEGEEEIIDAIEVVIQPSATGLSVAFAPYMFPFNKELTGIHIDLCDVLCSLPADEQMLAQYTQATTGITITSQMPPKGSGLSLVKP